MELKCELLKKTLNELDEVCPPDLFRFVIDTPELSKLYDSLHERIDSLYPHSTVEEFKALLREYWLFHTEAYKEFSRRKSKQVSGGHKKENIAS